MSAQVVVLSIFAMLLIAIFALFPMYCLIHCTIIESTDDHSKYNDIYDYNAEEYKTGWWKFVSVARYVGWVVSIGLALTGLILLWNLFWMSREHSA
jgi:hypothetical protein